jgi:hypothetical protein
MIIDVLMILALAMGSQSGQSLESSTATTETNSADLKIATNCYRNGIWYNPCPPDPDPDTYPPRDPVVLDQQ